MTNYLELLYLIAFIGILAVAYSYLLSGQIISASAGNSKMQEIAEAIQIGAKAYLNRQYKTIAVVGIIVLAIVTYFFNYLVGIGYFIGAFLSGVAGYVGMLISVKANVRTAEAARQSLQAGLTIAFKSGAITGLLVAGLALLSITFNKPIGNGIITANNIKQAQQRCESIKSKKPNKGSEAANAVISILFNGPKKI